MASFAVLSAQTGFVMAETFLSLFAREDLGINLAFIGSLFAVRHFVQIFLRLPMGALSDYVGRKRIILLGLFCYASTLGIYTMTQHWIHLLFGLLVHAVGMSSLFTALFALVGDCYPKNTGTGFAKIFMMLDGGSLVAPIIGGRLLSSQQLGITYQILFTIDTIIVFIGFFATLLLMKDSLPESRRLPYESLPKLLRTHLQDSFTRARHLIHDRYVLVACVTMIFLGFPMILTSTFFPLFGDDRGLTKDEIGLAMGIRSAIPAIFYIPLGKISDKYGPFAPTIFSLIAIGTSLLLVPFYYSLLAYIILLMLTSISWGIGTPAISKTLLLGVTETDRGMALGTWGVFVSFGRTIASVSLGLFASFFGLAATFLISAIMLFVGAVIFFKLYIPYTEPRKAIIPEL